MLRCGTALAAGAGLCAACTAAAGNGNLYLDLAAGYRSGDFGTAVTSDLYDITPELGLVSEDYSVAVSLPYLVLHSDGQGATSTTNGIGDLLLSGSARAWSATDDDTDLTLGASVKFPTGDETKGLGTGATNYGGFLSLNHRMGASLISIMSGYIVVGAPSGSDYNDVIPYGVGFQRAVGGTNLYTSLQGQTASIPGGQAPLEWDAGLFHVLSADYVVHAGGFVGLSDGSPAFGLSAGVVRWF